MKRMLMIALSMLATVGWLAAQQPGTAPDPSAGQATPPSAQTPGTSPSQTPAAPSQGAEASPTITAGCLGGSNPNYTITSSSGTTYKLNIPPNADTSKLGAHVGESVNVAGNVNDTGSPSIDVRGIGKGTGTCPAGGANTTQPPPKQ